MRVKGFSSNTARKLAYVVILTAAALSIPLVAMQFSDHWQWTVSDFVYMGVLIFGTGYLCVVAAATVRGPCYRMALRIALVLALLLIWAEGAVGIFD